MAQFQPGQSGNPSGRPKKNKTMTDILTIALSKTVETKDGKVGAKRVLAELVVEAVTTGKVTFPGDELPSTVGVKDWTEFVKWIYERIDGKPVQPTDNAIHGELTINTWRDFVESAQDGNADT